MTTAPRECFSRYQQEKVVELLDRMAAAIVERGRDRGPAQTLGGLWYLVWEARKLLDLPDIEGLDPFQREPSMRKGTRP